MPDSEVEDEKRLSNALAGLRNHGGSISAWGRCISDTGPPDAVRAILQEIDETVLRRQLCFANDEGADLTLDVAERRMFRLSNRATTGADAAQELTALSANDATAVAHAIKQFCAATQKVHVRPELPIVQLPAGVIGISIADLSAHLSTQSAGTTTLVTIDAALAACQKFALAVFDPYASAHRQITGQAAIGTKLQTLDGTFGAGTIRSADGDHCAIWMGSKVGAPAILRVVCKGRRLWVAFEPDQLDACMACWSAVFD